MSTPPGFADDGHQVHIVDPMARHVERVHRLAGPRRQITAELGYARMLPAGDASADAVLLLGPLYHLTDRSERLRAIDEAGRVVRPGGLVFVAAISRFTSLLGVLHQLECSGMVIWRNGQRTICGCEDSVAVAVRHRDRVRAWSG